ncbi:hypothetical protein NYE33_07885 [Paenibacillus sp. FSL R10-2199]|uniref:hypothetical protein n=1 Tax=Paenibacillus sp. FSL R10-2199 TaxID=2975348 RepID=UPI0030FC1698
MKTTGNLGLKKPDGTDIVDITDLNGNMDILDTAVKAVQDHAADAVKHITAAERTAWNAKASTAAATASAAGLMAAADKAKLDGVAAGANNYVHPNHTGDVTSTGDGVTAIAPGVIVNADVNAAAAIDATKIGTGVVSNAEFGYLDGVTSGIQGQLNGKSLTVDYVRQPAYSVTAGTGGAYTVTLTPAPASLPEGFGITIVPNLVNTAGATLNVNGLGAIPLKDQKGIAYAAGKLLAGKPYMFRKVGTDFLADSAGGSGNAVAGDIRAGKTAATDAGDVTGTLAVQTGGTVTPGPSAQVKAAGIYDTAITVAGVSVPAANVLAGTTIAGTSGTMPNRTRGAVGGYTTAMSALGDSGGSLVMEPPTGYYEAGKNAGNFGTLIATDANFVPGNILSGKSIFGVPGSIQNQGGYTNAVNSAWDGNNMWIRIPQGGYVTNTGSGYPEIVVSAVQARADGNIISSNIRSGTWIYGVQGDLAPRLFASGTFPGGTYEAVVSGLSFTPRVIFCSQARGNEDDLYYLTYYNANLSTTHYHSNGRFVTNLGGSQGTYVAYGGFKLGGSNDMKYWEAWG